MKIFITGSTGYIGQKLVIRLLSQGHHVHALCRKAPDNELFNNPRIKVFEGDLFDCQKIDQAMQGCEQVYHMAAYARVWAKEPKTFFDINVRGTVNVLDAALRLGVKKLVFTSTIGTFGVSNGKLISEDMIRTVDFFNEYESSKFMAEEKVRHYACKGLHAVIVHPARVYGPGLWTDSNAVSKLVKNYVDGEWHIIPGNGRSRGCFAYIDDVVNGHLLAMENGRAGEKYILGGDNLDFNEFFDLLKKLSNKNYFLLKVPMPFMLMYGWHEEFLARWFGKEPLVTNKWVRKYELDLACSSEKAIRELGYSISPIETGLIQTLRWLDDGYYLDTYA